MFFKRYKYDRNEFSRAEALGELVPHLLLEQQEAVLGEALAAARKIEDERDRAAVLNKLALHLPPTQHVVVLGEALAAVREIENGWDRVKALGELVPYLSSWADLQPSSAASALCQTLSDLAQWPRSAFLGSLKPLYPFLFTLVPEVQCQAVAQGIFYTIQQAGEWWP